MMINYDANNTGYFTETEDLLWLATCGVENCEVADNTDWIYDPDQVLLV